MSDHRLDIATADFGGEPVNVYFGAGDGTMTEARYPLATGMYAIAVADLDGNGSPDLAVTSAKAPLVSVLFNAGDGTFRGPRTFLEGGTFSKPFATSITGVAIGDLDGDGHFDLAVAANDAVTTSSPDYHYDTQLRVPLQQNDGSFTTWTSPEQSTIQLGNVAYGDVNEDSNPDVVAQAVDEAGASGIAVMLGNGDGTFAAPTWFVAPGPDHATVPGEASMTPLLAHFVDPHRVDIVITYRGTVSILLGHGDRAPAQVLVGDLDGDGREDVITLTSDRPNIFAMVTRACVER
jgi:hypothetical protein